MVKIMNGGEYSMPFFLPHRPQNIYSTIRVATKQKAKRPGKKSQIAVKPPNQQIKQQPGRFCVAHSYVFRIL
jgi:hypothetical protein